jgi:hypothetical protein
VAVPAGVRPHEPAGVVVVARRITEQRPGIEAEMGNVPMHAPFSAVGSFPSHQLGNSPSSVQGASIGLLYSRIGQKSDLCAIRCVRPYARGPDRPAPTRPPSGRHARPPRERDNSRPPPGFAGGKVARRWRAVGCGQRRLRFWAPSGSYGRG